MKQTILLVEDNADDIELTLHSFQKIDTEYRIEVARDGESALKYVFSSGDLGGNLSGHKLVEVPHLILLDINLPGISGLDVLKKLKQRDESKRIPIVILSTSDEESDIIESYNLGVNSYIQKPVVFTHFYELLKQLGQYWLETNIAAPQ